MWCDHKYINWKWFNTTKHNQTKEKLEWNWREQRRIATASTGSLFRMDVINPKKIGFWNLGCYQNQSICQSTKEYQEYLWCSATFFLLPQRKLKNYKKKPRNWKPNNNSGCSIWTLQLITNKYDKLCRRQSLRNYYICFL